MTPFAAAALHLVKSVDLKALTWRHHGLGMLQGELDEELRIHIWHPDLIRLPKGYRRVHDHRFRITSAVVLGLIVDQSWKVEFETGRLAPNTECWEIKHAKVQGAMKLCQGEKLEGCSTANDATLIGKCYARADRDNGIQAGHEYTIAAREFHTSIIGGLAISVVHRSSFVPGLARVLGDETVKVGSAIVRTTTDQEIGFYLDMAREHMIRAYTP